MVDPSPDLRRRLGRAPGPAAQGAGRVRSKLGQADRKHAIVAAACLVVASSCLSRQARFEGSPETSSTSGERPAIAAKPKPSHVLDSSARTLTIEWSEPSLSALLYAKGKLKVELVTRGPCDMRSVLVSINGERVRCDRQPWIFHFDLGEPDGPNRVRIEATDVCGRTLNSNGFVLSTD